MKSNWKENVNIKFNELDLINDLWKYRSELLIFKDYNYIEDKLVITIPEILDILQNLQKQIKL